MFGESFPTRRKHVWMKMKSEVQSLEKRPLAVMSSVFHVLLHFWAAAVKYTLKRCIKDTGSVNFSVHYFLRAAGRWGKSQEMLWLMAFFLFFSVQGHFCCFYHTILGPTIDLVSFITKNAASGPSQEAIEMLNWVHICLKKKLKKSPWHLANTAAKAAGGHSGIECWAAAVPKIAVHARDAFVFSLSGKNHQRWSWCAVISIKM